MNKNDPNELLAEGRRWIYYPDDRSNENQEWRLKLVIEDEHGYWPVGILTNDPAIPPPPTITANSQEEAVECCKAEAEGRGIFPADYDLILVSSMKHQHCKVIVDPDTLATTILDSEGDELLTLSEDDAKALFFRMEAALWPYGRDEYQDAEERELYGVERYKPESGFEDDEDESEDTES